MWTLLLAFILAHQPSEAKPKEKKIKISFCTPAEKLGHKINECEDNDVFEAEGEKCLDKIDEEEKKIADLLPENFSANSDSLQKEKFASSLQNYQATSEALGRLIGLTKIAENDILEYKYSLGWPADIDEPEVTNGDELAYAMSVDCYGTNRENLESLLEDFQTRRTKFEKIKAVADTNAGVSSAGKESLDNSDSATSSQKLLKAGKSATIKKKAKSNSQSTITGPIEEKPAEPKAK